MKQPQSGYFLRSLLLLITLFGTFFGAGVAHADARDKAHRIFSRLAGVPPTAAQLDEMEALAQAGNLAGVAAAAAETDQFLEVTVRDFLASFTDRDQSPRVDYNDFIATGTGMVRDGVSFDQILYADIVYTGPTSAVTPALAPLAPDNNLHYTALESHPAGIKTLLTRRTQSEVTPGIAPAGAFSMRSWGESYYQAGTNRRSLRFAMVNFLCRDLEAMSDVTRPDFRVRRDVSRTPGGDGAVFKTKCVGCHAGMDTLAGAFAFYNFDANRLQYTNGVVQEKYNINPGEFPDGYITTDDSWLNNWLVGANASVGWPADKTSGNGAASFGQMLAATAEFPRCMAQRVFKKVCLKKPDTDAEKLGVTALATSFAAGKKFDLKALFTGVATLCAGE